MLAAIEVMHPVALWGLALAIPIVLFHLYYRRRVRVVVPFVGLIRESIGPMRPAARFRKLREAAALVTRLLALTAFVLALSGLRPAEAVAPTTDLVVVVDADVTAGAVEADGRLRVLHGLDLAEAWVNHHADGRVGIVLATDPVSVLSEPDDNPATAADAIDALRARFTGGTAKAVRVGAVPAPATTDLGAAVNVAADAARRRGPGRVVVVSAREFDPPTIEGVEIDVAGAGSTSHDQRILDFSVTPADDANLVRVTWQLANDGGADARRTLVVDVGPDRVIEREALFAPASTLAPAYEDIVVPDGGAWLRVALDGSDAFPANDSVTAWLAPPTKPSILLVHGEKVRLATLLVLEGLGDRIDWDKSGRVNVADLAQAEPRDVTIVDGAELPPGSLEPGAWIFLAPLAGELPFDTGPVIDKPLVWRTESAHPLVRWLDFAAAHVRKGVPLSGDGFRALAYADGKPVIGEGENAGVRYVALGLDPDASLLPVQAGLPLFLRRAILRLVEAPRRPLDPFYRSGGVIRPRAPLPGGPEATIAWESLRGDAARGRVDARVDPEGRSFRVPAGAHGPATLFTGDPGAPTWEGRTGFVDLDPERDILPARPPGEPPAPRVLSRSGADSWWRMLVLAALALLLLDLLILSRTRKAR